MIGMNPNLEEHFTRSLVGTGWYQETRLQSLESLNMSMVSPSYEQFSSRETRSNPRAGLPLKRFPLRWFNGVVPSRCLFDPATGRCESTKSFGWAWGASTSSSWWTGSPGFPCKSAGCPGPRETTLQCWPSCRGGIVVAVPGLLGSTLRLRGAGCQADADEGLVPWPRRCYWWRCCGM